MIFILMQLHITINRLPLGNRYILLRRIQSKYLHN